MVITDHSKLKKTGHTACGSVKSEKEMAEQDEKNGIRKKTGRENTNPRRRAWKGDKHNEKREKEGWGKGWSNVVTEG